MKTEFYLQRTTEGIPKRIAIRCGYADKERVKLAGSGTARWSKIDKVWTIPVDPVILKRLIQYMPGGFIHPSLQEFLDELYHKQMELHKATGMVEPVGDQPLYPFQNASVRVMDTAGSIILGHKMGLGKTPITCAALDYVSAKRALIVCPSSVKWSWVDHLRQWAGRDDLYVLESAGVKTDLATVFVKGRDEQLHKLHAYSDQGIILMSYDMLRIHQKTLCCYDYDVIVFDEAHRLKNRKSQSTQAAMDVCKCCDKRWFLTGTPVRNHYTDLFTLLSMVDPVRFNGYWNFVNTYMITVQNPFGGTDVVGLKDESEFNSMLSVYMYKLTKEEVMKDLPPKIYHDVKLPMTVEQQGIYEEMEKELLVMFEKELEDGKTESQIISAPNTVAQLIRLRQIALSPELIGGPEESAKLNHLNEIVEDILAEGEKLLIFSYFRGFIELVAQMLDYKGLPYGMIVGGQKSSERHLIQQRLTEGDLPIVIGTAQSMGEGMNLQAAGTAIFTDIDWVPANNEQAEDRIHRGRLVRSPNIIRLYHPNTVETDIWATCRRKEGIIDEAVGSAETIRNLLLRRE